MNERLEKLAEQAGIFRPKEFYQHIDALQLEKFAELIVRECAKVCRDQPNIYAHKADRDNCAIAIEEHFGVEE